MTIKFSREEMINDFINWEMDIFEPHGMEEARRIFKRMADTLGKDESIIEEFEQTFNKDLYREVITEYYNNLSETILEFEHGRVFDNKYDNKD